jgi:DivIVA domain-containing protein
MRKNKLNYSINKIMDVRFRQAFRGYHVEDVDAFLDSIIEDYVAFDKEIERLTSEIENLKKGYGYK